MGGILPKKERRSDKENRQKQKRGKMAVDKDKVREEKSSFFE